jgi:hypothetical protein
VGTGKSGFFFSKPFLTESRPGARSSQQAIFVATEKVAKIVGQRMKFEPHGVGRERPARQPRPLDRALAFLDPLSHVPRLKATTRSAGRDRLVTMKPTRG